MSDLFAKAYLALYAEILKKKSLVTLCIVLHPHDEAEMDAHRRMIVVYDALLATLDETSPAGPKTPHDNHRSDPDSH